MTAIVDVSAPINWAAFSADRGQAVIIKCTEGHTVRNASFSIMKADAISAGLSVGSYHFLHAGYADKQASFYLSTLNPVHGERVVCDAEVSNTTPKLVDIKSFVSAIRSLRPDLRITIYGSYSFLKETVGIGVDSYLRANTDLWVAEWENASAPDIPSATWPTWALWQFTGTQRQYGGSIDLNKFNGTNDELRAWVGPGSAPAPHPPAPVPNDLSTIAGLQRALNLVGYGLTVDGSYGAKTGAALSSATDNGALFKGPNP